jgi:hypothetical protein
MHHKRPSPIGGGGGGRGILRRSKGADRIRRSKGTIRSKGTVNPGFRSTMHTHTLGHFKPRAPKRHTPLIPVVYLIYLASQITVANPRHRGLGFRVLHHSEVLSSVFNAQADISGGNW